MVSGEEPSLLGSPGTTPSQGPGSKSLPVGSQHLPDPTGKPTSTERQGGYQVTCSRAQGRKGVLQESLGHGHLREAPLPFQFRICFALHTSMFQVLCFTFTLPPGKVPLKFHLDLAYRREKGLGLHRDDTGMSVSGHIHLEASLHQRPKGRAGMKCLNLTDTPGQLEGASLPYEHSQESHRGLSLLS